MDQKILAGRLASISNDIRCLNEVIVAMKTTDVSRFPEKYGAMSVDAARRAEWIALRLRHLVYALPFTWKRDYLPKKLFSIYPTAPERDIIVEQEGAEADEKKLSE